jgi:DNA-binding response OmpR family regulator
MSDWIEASVLVVEDEPGALARLVENLAADRFAVHPAGSGEEAIELLSRVRPDVAVVDVRLPGLSGLDLVSAVREAVDGPWDPEMPILLISGVGDPHAAVRGIERGADDFLAKPFHYPELLVRLGAHLRRARGSVRGGVIRVGPLLIDRHARRATLEGVPVPLSAKEFQLLVALARDPARVYSKGRLLREVWGFASPGRTRTVDSHASRLRRKLLQAGSRERLVTNVWGVGYRLLPDDV